MQAFEIEEPAAKPERKSVLKPPNPHASMDFTASPSIQNLLPPKRDSASRPRTESTGIDGENYWLKRLRIATKAWFAHGLGLVMSVVVYFVVMILVIIIRPLVWEPDKYHYAARAIEALDYKDYPADFDQLLGVGKSGEVYTIKISAGKPDKLIKISAENGVKAEKQFYHECLLANRLVHRIPGKAKRCFGIGSAKIGGKYKQFRVDEHARGKSLKTLFKDSEERASVALKALEEMCKTVSELMAEDDVGDKYFHHELSPKNIWVNVSQPGTQKENVSIMLVGFGSPDLQPSSEEMTNEALRLTYRWFGYDLLWVFGAKNFNELSATEKKPEFSGEYMTLFDPLFKEFFLPTEDRNRENGLFKEELTPERIAGNTKMNFYFDQKLPPQWKEQWTDEAQAKEAMKTLLGTVFFGVAMATDVDDRFKADFDEIRKLLEKLRSFVKAE